MAISTTASVSGLADCCASRLEQSISTPLKEALWATQGILCSYRPLFTFLAFPGLFWPTQSGRWLVTVESGVEVERWKGGRSEVR